MNIQNNLPVFATIIEANYISTREDKISFETLTDEDIQEIQRLSKDPKIAQRVNDRLLLLSFLLCRQFRSMPALVHLSTDMKW